MPGGHVNGISREAGYGEAETRRFRERRVAWPSGPPVPEARRRPKGGRRWERGRQGIFCALELFSLLRVVMPGALLRAPLRLIRHIDAFNAAIGNAVAWLWLPIVVAIMADVVSRHFFATGSVALQELEWHFHGVLFLLAIALTYQRNGHVRIDVLSQHLSRRTRAWIEVVGCLLFLLPYSAVVFWLSLGFMARSWGFGEVSDAPGGLGYRWLIKSFLPLAFALIFLQGLSVLSKELLWLFGGPPAEERTHA